MSMGREPGHHRPVCAPAPVLCLQMPVLTATGAYRVCSFPPLHAFPLMYLRFSVLSHIPFDMYVLMLPKCCLPLQRLPRSTYAWPKALCGCMSGERCFGKGRMRKQQRHGRSWHTTIQPVPRARMFFFSFFFFTSFLLSSEHPGKLSREDSEKEWPGQHAGGTNAHG